jgi:glutathione synthase/RimK-type ligase-like ATP-grasp enzyme
LIAKAGFLTPHTLITNDPEAVLEFWHRHGRIIYKSISSERSIVKEFTARDIERLDAVRLCPVQFQELLQGDDLRVHVVGDKVFATIISTPATDYRYADAQVGEPACFAATTVGPEVAQQCVGLASSLGLAVAGIDFKVSSGQLTCLEVNPSPVFTYFEARTRQGIAKAIAEYLWEAGRF